jgi:hypothetical protein
VLRETAAGLRTAGRDNSFGYGLGQAFDAWHHCQEADLGGLPRRYDPQGKPLPFQDKRYEMKVACVEGVMHRYGMVLGRHCDAVNDGRAGIICGPAPAAHVPS